MVDRYGLSISLKWQRIFSFSCSEFGNFVITFILFYVDFFLSSITVKILTGLDNIWVTWWASYEKQKWLALREHPSSPPVFFGGVRFAHLFSFLCCPIIWVIGRVSYQRQKLLILREHLGSASVFGRVRVAHLFSFLLFSCFCLFVPTVSCVPNVARFFGLSIHDCPFGFL